MTTKVRGANLPVFISEESLCSDDARAPLDSNISVVNALFEEHLRQGEISHDALISYYVDYYVAQVNNGGFAQFVYNSAWNETIVEFIREGLSEMGARQHGALFEKGGQIVARRKGKLGGFLSSMFFGKNAERDKLNSLNAEFNELEQIENLDVLNVSWLKLRPGLLALPAAKLRQEVSLQANSITDRAARISEARKAEPQYMKLIRILCDSTGQSLVRITAGDPSHQHAGKNVLAWHFITDRGHHFMVESGGKAMMFEGKSKAKVSEVSVRTEDQ